MKRFFLAGTGTIVAIIAVLAIAGIRVNTTKSIPVGFYITDDAGNSRGRYVMFCPPDMEIFSEARERGYLAAGWCPGEYNYMMKKIAAMSGDHVLVTDDSVFVNGNRLPYSKPRKTDNLGRPLPRYQHNEYTLADNEVLLMSDVSSVSFDARYFGPLQESQIRTVINPVLVW